MKECVLQYAMMKKGSEVKNDSAKSSECDTESGLSATFKRTADSQGLFSIRKVAGKYAGDIEITVNKKAFCLTVLLMLECA